MELSKEDVELLKEVSTYLTWSNDLHSCNAVYYTPAAALRMQADAIERKDECIRKFRDFLERVQ